MTIAMQIQSGPPPSLSAHSAALRGGLRKLLSSRSDSSPDRIIAGELKPGEWFLVPRSLSFGVKNRLTQWRANCGLESLNGYMSESGYVVINGDVPRPPELTPEYFGIRVESGPPPLCVRKKCRVGGETSPYANAVKLLKPGEWFLVPATLSRKIVIHAGKWRKRYQIAIKTFHTETGDLCVIREPDGTEAFSELE